MALKRSDTPAFFGLGSRKDFGFFLMEDFQWRNKTETVWGIIAEVYEC